MNTKLKPYKKDFPHSYTLGVFPTIELLENQPHHAQSVVLHTKGKENRGVEKIRALCAKHGIPCQENDKTIQRIAHKGNTYAVGVFQKHPQKLSHDQNHVVLINPSGMGNLGTIMRAMLGFGARDLAIIEPAADYFHPKVIRASMGAIFQVQTMLFNTFADYWGTYSAHTLYPMMTDGEKRLDKVQFNPPYALVFGNESEGLGEEYHQFGTSLRIPQNPNIDSLNIAISVGIALYQVSVKKY
ncbi:MAG: 23S rRNA (adenosine(1067)-2'-O)-methyltransferase [Chloroflexi bacterium]|nr:23S rRNA (adenosine(1067)-2'-O)-methyltransferase [Chloroflexota bacterium]